LGGTAAVPTAVDSRLQSLGYDVVRLGGQNRMDTARLVAAEVVQRIHELGGTTPTRVLLATGLNWPDAVAGGSLGALFGYPIVLTAPTSLSPEAKSALAALDVNEVDVLGGTAVVSDATAAAAGVAAGAPVRRFAGTDRDGTAVAIAREVATTLADDYGLAVVTAVAVNLRRADGFAHVLSASAIVGSEFGVFLPVEGDGGTTLPAATSQLACELDPSFAIVAGGSDVVADATVQQLDDVLTGPRC
jgi:putative cell wall-binding protein